jgi:hypothetical protein
MGARKLNDELGLAKELLMIHLGAYYAATEKERTRIAHMIDDAWRMDGDIISDTFPGRQWNHAWPEAVRCALSALWSTPR